MAETPWEILIKNGSSGVGMSKACEPNIEICTQKCYTVHIVKRAQETILANKLFNKCKQPRGMLLYVV